MLDCSKGRCYPLHAKAGTVAGRAGSGAAVRTGERRSARFHNDTLRRRRLTSRSPPHYQGSRLPSVPSKATPEFSLAEHSSQLIVLRSRCTTRMHFSYPDPCTCTDRFQAGSFLFGPDRSCPETTFFFPTGHGRPTYPPRALAFGSHRRSPSLPPTRITPPRLLLRNTPTAANTAQLQPFLGGYFPRGCAPYVSCLTTVPTSDGQTLSHLSLSTSPQHHYLRRIASTLPSRGNCQKASLSKPHTAPFFKLDPIRIGNHQRCEIPRFDTESPSASTRRQGIGTHTQYRT